MKNKIQYFPITLYPVVMGLAGLAIVLSKFYELNWLPPFLFEGVLYFVSALFVFLSVMYGLKAILFFHEVVEDWRHRIRINFFSSISISFLLLAIAWHPVNIGLAHALWWIGMISHTFLMLHTIAFWIQHNFEIKHFNPAWFIPVVGNILIPIMGVEFLPAGLLFFYFAVGAFFWIVLFTLFLNRVIFHHQMPQKFIPTLFILIAPPAVGFISYFKLTHQWDMVGEFLLSITYFFVLLLVFLVRSFKNLKFFVSWWAFIFPLDALTIASILAYKVSEQPFYKYVAWGGLAVTLVFVGMVGYQTLQKIKAGEICVKDEE